MLLVQAGFIQQITDAARNLYEIRLESGLIVTAFTGQNGSGDTDRFADGDYVIAVSVAGGWCIIKKIPGFTKDGDASPRLQSLQPGDKFIGNAKTGAGVHVTGGQVSIEAAGLGGDGNAKRSAGIYLIPDSDAIRALCRRFELDAAGGIFQSLHDDETGKTCMRMWARQNAKPLQDGRVARVQMGYHKAPDDTIFSVYLFPSGPDPMTGNLDFDFKYDPETESRPFGGQWPKVERDDWCSRFYFMTDGTAVYESADVPAPSPVKTLPAQVNSRVQISPFGEVKTELSSTIELKALSQIISLKKDLTMTADGTVKFTCDDIQMGDPDAAIPVVNLRFFLYFQNLFTTWAANHIHTVTGSVTLKPTVPPPQANDNGKTKNVRLS